MRRRDFITLLGAAAAWPLAARAQQAERARRVAGLFTLQGQEDRGLAALWEEPAKLGWIEGRNLQIDLRFAPAADRDRMQAYAMELVSLDPDVIVTLGTEPTRVMQQQTRTIPIIYIAGAGAEIGGVVRNISRPEGNITGVALRYVSLAGKWVQLLKEAAPRLARVAMIFGPEASPSMLEGGGYRAPIEAAATLSGVQPIWIPFTLRPNWNEASLHSRPSRMAASSLTRPKITGARFITWLFNTGCPRFTRLPD